MQTSIASGMAPPFKIISKYFIAAISYFLLLTFLMLVSYQNITGFHFQPRILAIVHLTVLGWISMIIFGALYQLIPVVLEVTIYSKKLAEAQFWFFTIGTAGLSTSFWFFRTGVELLSSAFILMFSILIFVLNIGFTLKTVKKWNITGYYIAASLAYLLITALFGFFLSFNLSTNIFKINHLLLLKIHAHTGFAGWFSMVIIGVALKLIPMFSLSHDYKTWPVKISFFLINAGIILLGYSLLNENNLILYISAALLISGFLLFILQILMILKHRIRKAFDTGLRYSVVAFSFIVLVLAFGILILKGKELETNFISIYGFGILFGFVSLLIKAQMYKIVPFLVWYNKYSSKAGLEKVPMLKDMFNDTIANSEFIIFLIGLVSAMIGFYTGYTRLLLPSFTMIFISSILFTYNMIEIYRK